MAEKGFGAAINPSSGLINQRRVAALRPISPSSKNRKFSQPKFA